MIGKTIGMLLIMTASIVVLPIQVAMLVSRSREFRGSTYLSNLAVATEFCNWLAERQVTTVTDEPDKSTERTGRSYTPVFS